MESFNSTSECHGFLKENLQGYELVNTIENGIREFIIFKMKELHGLKWRIHLPSDILHKYQEGFRTERDIKWVRCYIHHPLYYLDFPDLQKIIITDKLWGSLFKAHFGRKDIVSAELSSIEAIRNWIAHNRRIHPQAIRKLQATVEFLNNSLKPNSLQEFAAHQFSCVNIKSELNNFIHHITSIHCTISKYQSIIKTSINSSVLSEWWFDDAIFGLDRQPIEAYISFAEVYADFSPANGKGHLREKYAIDNDHNRLFNDCIKELNKFMKEVDDAE